MYKKILLPVDLNHPSAWRKTLPTALELAGLWQGQLRLLFVIPPIHELLIDPYTNDSFEDDVIKEANSRLDQFVADNLPDNVEATSVVREGSAYRRILHEAKKWRADAIVMAANRTGMEDYLLGSHAARVVRHASCSVFIVRE